MTSQPESAAIVRDAAYLELTYGEARLPRTAYPAKLAHHLAQRFLDGPGRLIDVGCGRGEFLDAFKALGCDVAGVDVSPAAPGMAPGHDIRVADLERDRMPFEAGSFDYAFSKSVLEHTRQPVAVLKETLASLKPGGTGIVMVPSWETGYRGSFYVDHTHVTPFTLPGLEDAMTLAGFEVVHGQLFYQLPFLWRWPLLKPLVWLIGKLPLPYRPMHKVSWPDSFNKLIWFSKEAMVLVVGRRPA